MNKIDVYVINFFDETNDKDISFDKNACLTLQISEADTIATLKGMIESSKGYAASKQRLMFLKCDNKPSGVLCCKPLEILHDKKTLSNLHVLNKSWLLLKELKIMELTEAQIASMETTEEDTKSDEDEEELI